MNYQELLTLIDKLDQSSVAYVEFNQGPDKVVLAKDVPKRSDSTPTQSTSTVNKVVHTPTSESNEVVEEVKENTSKGDPVLSPLVGVAYLQPKPDAAPFVNIGDVVKKGQVLCIVEAMKLMNDIVSPFDGVITEILITNETVVEFNQPLFKIEQR